MILPFGLGDGQFCDPGMNSGVYGLSIRGMDDATLYSMTVTRFVFNVIYVLAFASSIAVAVKEARKSHSANIPTTSVQAQANRMHVNPEGMLISHSMTAQN